MAIRLITGRLQQGSRYRAKEKQILQKTMRYTLQFMVATTCDRKHKPPYYITQEAG